MSVDYINIHAHGQKVFNDVLQVRNIVVGEESEPVGQFFSAGIHPWYIQDTVEQQRLLQMMAQNASCLFIGECGLDTLRGAPMNQQEDVFRWHVQLSEELKKPLIIHCVKAIDRLLIIKKHMCPNMPWIIHGFQGKTVHLERFMRASCMLSFGADVLNPTRGTLRECLRTVPLEHVFLETDESSHRIQDIYQVIAQIREMDIEDLKLSIQDNFTHLF